MSSHVDRLGPADRESYARSDHFLRHLMNIPRRRHSYLALEHRAARLGRRKQDPHRQQVGLVRDKRAVTEEQGPRARKRARRQVHGDLGESQRGRRGGVLHTCPVRRTAAPAYD